MPVAAAIFVFAWSFKAGLSAIQTAPGCLKIPCGSRDNWIPIDQATAPEAAFGASVAFHLHYQINCQPWQDRGLQEEPAVKGGKQASHPPLCFGHLHINPTPVRSPARASQLSPPQTLLYMPQASSTGCSGVRAAVGWSSAALTPAPMSAETPAHAAPQAFLRMLPFLLPLK